MSSSPWLDEVDPDHDGYMLFSCRKEWSDVKPLPQNDLPEPEAIVKINYNEKCKERFVAYRGPIKKHFLLPVIDAFDYFRAVYASKELSLRAFQLTQVAAEFNTANYTVWHHRR